MIEVYEDGAGVVYLRRGDELWAMGAPSSVDNLRGAAAADAESWDAAESGAGGWRPNRSDGETPADLSLIEAYGFDLIAVWSRDAGLAIAVSDGHVVARAAGRFYLGVCPVCGGQLELQEWAVAGTGCPQHGTVTFRRTLPVVM